jgi:1,4-dihydroxy-2-naphthoate octaprenyltransferase
LEKKIKKNDFYFTQWIVLGVARSSLHLYPMKTKIIFGILIGAISFCAAWFFPKPWSWYVCGLVHAIIFFGTIGYYATQERDRRFNKWLRETSEAAASDTEAALL